MKIFGYYITKNNPRELLRKIAELTSTINDKDLEIDLIKKARKKDEECFYKIIGEFKKTIKIYQGKNGGLTKENNKLKKQIEKYEKIRKLDLKEIKKLEEEVEVLKSDRYKVRRITPAVPKTSKQTMKIKNARGQGELKKKSAAEFVAENLKVRN